ncbi:hypothetical protein SEVIR_5G388300v4 [Setaria viridis]|uniref:RING-type domain-containing protein n=1 Tax=Setaria viridis TaxID=4556 RepID=A0A4U6UUE8_SETVI|nr:trithorax group protein osa-like [Setaria viridis]XP_034593378.1 trithorax group protein osa-like [Setaria viridis]TKW17749.1 hypothetical protein SEVIR_5G388300v2 [Setaria viridis]
MGFDNECIMSIQSLPGEYFCPVCRTLIYPNEALQTQCTHLYCKPCLAYVAATTKACPYDGYLVTETDSKPLTESNKSLAETIGKVTVHCLYNKSGCQWQGTLSACITHSTACAYGNSPVVCNRCGTQIVHRQVQEHAQLCPGSQSQTHQADGSQAQPSAATTQAITQDPSLAPAGSAAAPAMTLPSAATATAVTASAAATGGATGASTATAPPSLAAASAASSQTPTAEQWYQQQLQCSQYYQQQYPGYNPYMQQYQQYGQYQQVHQQYTQPQMQVASQNMTQGSAQPTSYVQPQVQSSQPQLMTQPQSQPRLPPPTGYAQPQQHPVQPQPQPQPQSQPHLPHLQAPSGQSQPQQPIQSAPQVPQLQPQSQVPLQLSGPTLQPAQVQAQPPQQQQTVAQQQHAHMQALPPQQNLQPQMQLNSQVKLQSPQVQQQSYPQPQAYAPQSQQQMPHSASLQHPVSQHPASMRPPLPGQQPAMQTPQGIQHTTQHQQHIGYPTQRPQMHSVIPSQTSLQGLPPHSYVSSQGQPYQQGIPSSQQHLHSQPSQPHGQPYMQQHVPGYGYAGHHVQTSAGRPTSHLAPPQQFLHQPGGPVNSFQDAIKQQPTMLRSDNVVLASQLPAAGQPMGQGSVALGTHASQPGKSETASNAADSTAVSESKNNGPESAVMRPTMLKGLGDENINREHNDFGGVRKDAVQTGVASHITDGSIGRDGIAAWAGNSNGPVQGGKEHKASDNCEKGGSLQKASQKNAGAPGSFVPPGMGSKHPAGPERMLPQHLMHPGPKHGFSENIQPPMQKSYGSFHSGSTSRLFGENQIQMPMSQPGGIRPGDCDGMIRPPMVGPLPDQDKMFPPFVPEHLSWPHPLGTSRSNGSGSGSLVSGRAFPDEGFNTSGEHLKPLPAYPGRHNNIEDDLRQFPGPSHLDGPGLQMGPRPFERALGRPDSFSDSLPGRPPFPNQKSPFPVALHEDFSRKPNAMARHSDFLPHGAEFNHHGADVMPNFRNPGMSGGPRKDQLGSGNLPGNVQHAFDGPEFPPHFLPGHMYPGDPNLFADYSRHGFPKEPVHFGLGGPLRNGDVGWCRICMFNCGSAENLDLHVQTREHQQFAMDIILKMKQDVAMQKKMNYRGPKSFHKKVAGKGHFRGNRR